MSKPFHHIYFLILCSLILFSGFTDGLTQEHDHEGSDMLGLNFSEGWFEPYIHSHFSPDDTPMIHSFRAEPAFTQRDFIFDYSYRNETEGKEHEIEAEIEWALTRRFGVIIETPYVFLDSDEESNADGFGNVAISPRVLLAEYERFLLAIGLEMELPTGTRAGDISEDRMALAPSLSAWIDLGNWWTVNAQTGFETAVDRNDTVCFLRSALLYTFASDDVRGTGRAHDDHDHPKSIALPPGLLTVILETDIEVGVAGAEDGRWSAEGIIGLSLGLSEKADIRAGYQFPLSNVQDLHGGLTCGIIYHF